LPGGKWGQARPAAQRADELRDDQFVLIRIDRAHDVGLGEEPLQRDLIVLREEGRALRLLRDFRQVAAQVVQIRQGLGGGGFELRQGASEISHIDSSKGTPTLTTIPFQVARASLELAITPSRVDVASASSRAATRACVSQL
jgi:hypothetical protein